MKGENKFIYSFNCIVSFSHSKNIYFVYNFLHLFNSQSQKLNGLFVKCTFFIAHCLVCMRSFQTILCKTWSISFGQIQGHCSSSGIHLNTFYFIAGELNTHSITKINSFTVSTAFHFYAPKIYLLFIFLHLLKFT